MKQYIKFILITIFTILIISCSSSDGSISAMIHRYDNFLKILPDDLKDAFSVDSKKYSSLYSNWQKEGSMWIENISIEENNGIKNIEAQFVPDTKEYAIGLLTNRFYERVNPYDLMNEVYNHTKILGESIMILEKQDQDFSNKLHRLKVDEAIENFNSEETAFYYLWNYAIMLDRPRRFQ